MAVVLACGIKGLHGVLDQLARVRDHGDMRDDEALLGRVAGEGADELEVAPDQALGLVDTAVVVETNVSKERREERGN